MFKKIFAAITTFFNLFLNTNSLKCISMGNQECKARTKVIDVNNNEHVFYPYSTEVNKCSASRNNINDPYAILYVPDIIKNMNIKVFNLMQRLNEARHILWHEICKCVCRLTSSICNSKQIWNEDKCRCECKEDLIDKGLCDKGYIRNPSNCQCECDKSCGIGEYLDYKNCVCRNSLVGKLVEECANVIDENKIYNETLNTTSSDECAFYTLYIVLFAVFLTTNVMIGSSFIYFHWYK